MKTIKDLKELLKLIDFSDELLSIEVLSYLDTEKQYPTLHLFLKDTSIDDLEIDTRFSHPIDLFFRSRSIDIYIK